MWGATNLGIRRSRKWDRNKRWNDAREPGIVRCCVPHRFIPKSWQRRRLLSIWCLVAQSRVRIPSRFYPTLSNAVPRRCRSEQSWWAKRTEIVNFVRRRNSVESESWSDWACVRGTRKRTDAQASKQASKQARRRVNGKIVWDCWRRTAKVKSRRRHSRHTRRWAYLNSRLDYLSDLDNWRNSISNPWCCQGFRPEALSAYSGELRD